MNQVLNISLVQYNVIWKSPEQNFNKLNSLLSTIRSETHLILLPEMFATGFIVDPEMEFGWQESTLDWMLNLSKNSQSVVGGSIPYTENGLVYNRLYFVYPNSEYKYYDKRHLFSIGGENICYTQGREREIMNVAHWDIFPLICYDLRFPVWSRNTQGYDLLLYVANWPAARMEVWNTLLKARAIENQSFVLGVNRIGTDGRGISYSGQSQLVSPKGKVLSSLEDQEAVLEVSIQKDELLSFRKDFPVLPDRDDFNFK